MRQIVTVQLLYKQTVVYNFADVQLQPHLSPHAEA